MRTFLLFDRNAAIRLASAQRLKWRQGVGSRYLFTLAPLEAEAFCQAVCAHDYYCLELQAPHSTIHSY